MSLLRETARRLLPVRVRRLLREAATELPVRLRDAGPDLLEAVGLGRRPIPLPPPSLRRGVGRTSSRREYEQVGRRAAEDLLGAVRRVGDDQLVLGPWLDFGCGSGRVVRHLLDAGVGELWGVDVDAVALAWAERHLRRARFERIDPDPPTGLDAGSFVVASAVSVFTHFDPAAESAWLQELHRLLAPDGLLVATTHGPDLVWSRPDLTDDEKRRLESTGFLFAAGAGRFNEGSAFHHRAYLEATWGQHFELVRFMPHGLAGFQDLSVWRRR